MKKNVKPNMRAIYNFKNKVFLILILSNQLYGDIDITTIDSWKIVSAGTNTLLVTKFSELGAKNGFLFQMERPYCLCETPTFIMYSPDNEGFERPKEDERINAELRVDFKKKVKVELEVFLALEEREQNILRLKGNFPSIREAKILELNSVYGSDKWVLNNLANVMQQAKKICESFLPYQDEEATKTRGNKV